VTIGQAICASEGAAIGESLPIYLQSYGCAGSSWTALRLIF
jgi:hypothetical protein